MRKRILSTLLIACTIMTSIVGCGVSDERFKGMSKDEIIAEYTFLEGEYNKVATKYNELNTVYQAAVEQGPTSAVSAMGDGSTGRLTFNSVDSKIIFPEAFKYPGAEQTSASGSISIVKNVAVTPGQNWICKLNGASLELEHSSGISGTIKVGEVTDFYEQSLLQDEVLAPWLSKLPKDTIRYENIFINGAAVGIQAVTPTIIDSEDAFLRCGMLAFGEYAVTYVFVYRSLEDATKNESILNVINSIKMSGNFISVGA